MRAPECLTRGEGSGEKQLDPPAERAQHPEIIVRAFSCGFARLLSPNVSIFCQGKTEHSPNRPAYPNSSGYSLPFSSAELRLATAGAPGGTAPGKDSPSTATPRPCVR